MNTYQDSGTVTKANLSTKPGKVSAFRVTNANAAVRYFQLHNKATAPVATDVPQLWFPIPAGTAAAPGIVLIDQEFLAPEELLSTGVGWAISTTPLTFTDSATAAEHTTTVRYG